MTPRSVMGGTAHTLPKDVRTALLGNKAASTAWASLTPLARNEWICWVITVKGAATRKDHIRRLITELKEGKRRPCCWIGCIHRTDKAISPSVRSVLARKRKGS